MKNNTGKYNKGSEMYFSRKIAEKFVELEQNEKNFKVSEIVDQVLIHETREFSGPIQAAELGGGAHPDRYHEFFGELLENPRGHIDWVDISPHMLELAEKYISIKKYQNRRKVITFIESDILEYLRGLENEKLDVAIMKYTIDHMGNINVLFKLLSMKLKYGGKLIATVGILNPELKSFSTNARFLYNGKEFPENETRTLKDGDSFIVKFFKVSGDPSSGCLEGAQTIKYFHSAKKIRRAAKFYGFNIFLGDWKDFIKKDSQSGETLDQKILVLTRT